MALQMQINQLPVIPQAPADADVLAIEVNGVTYKVSKSALANAILGTIDTTPTQSSTRLVQSGGVYNAIQQSTANANLSIKNLAVADLSTGKTIVEMGLIGDSTASYVIAISLMQGLAQDVGSMYTARVVNGTFYLQSKIHEGTYASAPILQSDGSIKKSSGDAITTGNYRGIAWRFGT